MRASELAMQEALQAAIEAQPASGFRPETELEWQRVVAAGEKIGFAMYLEMGFPEPQRDGGRSI